MLCYLLTYFRLSHDDMYSSLLDKSLTGPGTNTESFLSLRTFKKFCVFLSLFFLFFVFSVFFWGFFSLYFDIQLQAVVYLRVVENLYITVMVLVGFSTSAV